MYKLRQAQLDAGKKESEVLGLIQDVDTRWTAAFEMLERTVLLYDDYIHKVLSKSKKAPVRQLTLSAETIWQMKELSSALKPMCTAMQAMGGDSYPSISLLEPLIYKLLNTCLVVSDRDTPIVYAFKTAARADLATRYQSPHLKALFCQATFLDPRFAKFEFISNEVEREATLQLAKNELVVTARRLRAPEIKAVQSLLTCTHGDVEQSQTQNGPTSAKRSKGNLLTVYALHFYIHSFHVALIVVICNMKLL